MPRPAYIFLKTVLMISAFMLLASALLFTAGDALSSPYTEHMAQLLLENPAGVLLIGAVGLAFILDRC